MPVAIVAPAKLTRSLRITGVRADGYHLIDAEMVALDLADRLTFDDGDGLEIRGGGGRTFPRGDDADGDDIEVRGGGAAVPLGDDNLVRRALAAVQRTAHVTLDKAIPAGAGLGGGSADAAAVLRWAGRGDLELAASLGADVPFCLVGGRARVRGIGEQVEPLPFENRTFTLLTPPVPCSTPAIYRAWDDLGGPTAAGPNDLEPAAVHVVPELARWRDQLGDATGETPVLAGSGSTWFVPGAHPAPHHLVVHTVPSQALPTP